MAGQGVKMRFRDWLRNSNEAAVFRQSFETIDTLPMEHGIRMECFEITRRKAEAVFQKVKQELEGEEPQ